MGFALISGTQVVYLAAVIYYFLQVSKRHTYEINSQQVHV